MPDFFLSHPMAHLSNRHSHTSEVRASTSWAQDNPPVVYYKGYWLSMSLAEPLMASERLKQYDALGHRKHVPCAKEYTSKPFGVHSNELINHEYYYDWSIAWWICRKSGQPIKEAVMLEIEQLIA
jgi:hypothetical protein